MKRFPMLFALCVLGLAGVCFLTASEPGVKGQGTAVKEVPFETTIEPSAVEPIGEGKFLLAANDKLIDKRADLLIVDAEKKVIVNRLPILEGNPSNPKWEAMAKDGSDYYVYGVKCTCLYRFNLQNERETDPAKIEIKEKPEEIKLKFKIPLKNPEDRIEGLAVLRNETNEKELIFGIREDLATGLIRVYRGVIRDNNELVLDEFFAFTAKKDLPVEWHLSSIEYVKSLDGFLIITSTEQKGSNEFYGNKLWFVSRKKLNACPSPVPGKFKDASELMIEGKVFEPEMKAEGLALIGDESRVVIVFDNDGKNAKLAMLELSELIQIK